MALYGFLSGGKSVFCSSSIIKCIVNDSAREMKGKDRSNNNAAEKSECLIILSLHSGLQRGRIDQK